MQISNGEFTISRSELAARINQSGQQAGPLNVLAQLGKNAGPEHASEGANHDPIKLKLLAACIRVLIDPAKVIRLHYSLADATVSRATCAASAYMPGVWVTLAGSGDQLRISLRSEPEMLRLVAETLAAEALIRPTWIGGEHSTDAALALLAVLDQVRRAWLVSLLRNLEPLILFTPDDLKERLLQSEVEDFRWLLNMTDKVLPLTLKDLAVADEPRPAMLELIEAGLIMPVDDTATQFTLTEAGQLVSEANKQAASRLALSQTFFTLEGDIAHDVLVLFRGPLDLFMILMSGAASSFASLLPGDLELLLRRVFDPPPLRSQATRDKYKISAEAKEEPCPDDEVAAAAEELAAETKVECAEDKPPGPAFWYTSRDGDKKGPYSPEQFKALYDAGLILPGDLIWNETLPQWQKAEDLLRL